MVWCIITAAEELKEDSIFQNFPSKIPLPTASPLAPQRVAVRRIAGRVKDRRNQRIAMLVISSFQGLVDIRETIEILMKMELLFNSRHAITCS